MSSMFYSDKERGFYDESRHAGSMPPDSVGISQADYVELLSGLPSGKRIVVGGDGLPSLIDAPAHVVTKGELCALVDTAADAARAKVVADPVRAMEYQMAAQEAQAFAAAGYPLDAVPRTVAAYAIKGRTPRESADSIIAEAAAYNEALYAIREVRLAAKAEIQHLMTIDAPEQAKTLAEATVAHIQSMVAGVGNAGATTEGAAV